MTKKIKWIVDPAPTGKYRSFEHRSWPTGVIKATDEVAFCIRCADEYTPACARTGEHRPLRVQVAVTSTAEERKTKGLWSWRTMTGEFKTLDEAKAAAEEFYAKLPGLFDRTLARARS